MSGKINPPKLNSMQMKLSGVMLLVLGFILCMNLFIFVQINSAVQRIDAVFSSNVTINELADTLDLVQNTVYEYLTTKSSQALENYYRYEQDYRELLSDLNNRNLDSEIKMLEKNIRNMSESYLEQTSYAILAKRGRNVERYKEAYEQETLLFQYINTYIYDLNNLQFRQNSANYQILLSSMNVLEHASILIMLVVFVVGIFIAMLLVRNMIRPLTALSTTAYEVAKGNLDVPLLPIVSEDEVGVVTHAFNQMLESIRENIEKLKDSMEKESLMKERQLSMEAHLKDAQLKFLQAQINPHFLFNSLNAGAQLAVMEDAERTEIFLEKMADFFRYNVRKMGDEATLQEEIESVDNYIYILNVRFAGDIHYEKEVDEGVGEILIPSMILQPLVENAVQHGIHDCMENGVIRLSIHREDLRLRITVSDNGEGMTPETIRAVMEGRADQEKKGKDSTGIALDNVIHRLQLYYNQENLLQIESAGIGKGTQITILLPLGQKGEEECTES
ncbi:MAG: histidine kinase [Eubacteriales bacterium]|nr:histidine kinase [Eubacteriales bacterium]